MRYNGFRSSYLNKKPSGIPTRVIEREYLRIKRYQLAPLDAKWRV